MARVKSQWLLQEYFMSHDTPPTRVAKEDLPYQVKMQYLQILNIIDTSIKHVISHIDHLLIPSGIFQGKRK